MATHHLAHANYAAWKGYVAPEHVEKFLAHANSINESAVANPGLVWQNEADFFEDANVIKTFGNERTVFNMSIWNSFDVLKEFVYGNIHLAAMKNRNLWFDNLLTQVYVLWWVKVDHKPTMIEAKEKFDLLNEIGPSPQAFTFTKPYPWQGAIP